MGRDIQPLVGYCPHPSNALPRKFGLRGASETFASFSIRCRERIHSASVLISPAWESKDYQPTEEELAAIQEWVAAPDIILTEDQLQRIYEFPGGSLWDFFLDVLGVKTIPTTRERIEVGFEGYLALYNFTKDQTACLARIKDVLVANLSSGGKVDLDAVFANPIYSRLIGSFDEANELFEGRLREVVGQMQDRLRVAA